MKNDKNYIPDPSFKKDSQDGTNDNIIKITIEKDYEDSFDDTSSTAKENRDSEPFNINKTKRITIKAKIID